jgi:hypothetical protein
MIQVPHLAAGLLALAVMSAPDIDTSDCANISGQYKTAVAKVVEALHGYERCIATNDQHNECAAEIQALDNAHDNFVDAVNDAKDCK